MEKLFYTIGEVAEMFNVNASLIRFWEKEFDVIKPARNAKGNRLFTKTDLSYFHQIFHLVKEKGYTLQGAKDALKAKSTEELDVNKEVLMTLKNAKKFLAELKESL